jgi:hypothetical protein
MSLSSHTQETPESPENPERSGFFSCKKCKYETTRSSQYMRHMSTKKHQLGKQKVPEYKCSICEKKYKHQSSLCKHTKICNTESPQLSNLIIEVLRSNNELQKQNQEMQKQMMDLCKNGINNTTNHNKSFNINLFLNEQCKNALNFSDFVGNIEVSREDLENNAQLGFVNGISKIILDNLKQLGINERPIHCTDAKREVMYIKDEDTWHKEDDDTKLRIAIQEVSRKSVGTLIDWKKNNPDYADADSEFSQQCLVMQRNSVAGYERDTYFPKIVKAVTKEITIDKT